jgi:hypothetical protein
MSGKKRYCTGHRAWCPLTQFYRQASTASGYAYTCKACQRKAKRVRQARLKDQGVPWWIRVNHPHRAPKYARPSP